MLNQVLGATRGINQLGRTHVDTQVVVESGEHLLMMDRSFQRSLSILG